MVSFTREQMGFLGDIYNRFLTKSFLDEMLVDFPDMEDFDLMVSGLTESMLLGYGELINQEANRRVREGNGLSFEDHYAGLIFDQYGRSVNDDDLRSLFKEKAIRHVFLSL